MIRNASVLSDPVGAPDFTLPVSILAQVIESLKVDIAAQTLSTLKIEISAVKTGLVIETNVANFPSVYPLPSDQVSALQQITIQNVAAGLYIPINIAQVSTALNISNFPSTYPLPDTQVSSLQNVTIQNVAAGLYIPINIAQVSTTINTEDTIVGVAAGVYIPITIHDIESGVVFDVNVTNVQSDVVFNVNITGTPTVNIQTSGGANIIIDKLTQSAYTERQSTLANNGATATMTLSNLTIKRGKFFPRGCRGFIKSIDVYCNNADTASHTFTIKISPMPGMGPVATFTLSVEGDSGDAWRSVTVGRFWNYDSLFIWVMSDSNSYGGLGYDTGEPYDYYASADEVSWAFGSFRYWFRVNMAGETVGDLPVSGTVNTIEVPASATFMQGSEKLVPNDTETSLVTVYGSGSIVEMGVVFYTATAPGGAVMYLLYAYADGQLAGIWTNVVATQSSTATSGRCPVGIFVQRSADTTLVFWIPLKFRRSFELRCKQTTGSSCTAYGRVIVNMIA
jgi:hypothetical protein